MDGPGVVTGVRSPSPDARDNILMYLDHRFRRGPHRVRRKKLRRAM